ncbi:MAG TPA: flagellar hook-associated protein FlgK [Azospirillum sp.]|nr:flagellar hook-associated protein FlgK [Azospirillum sp.]
MSLDLSIANALSGLKVVQRSIDTVSQNITNAQTPGYTRKTLAQSAVVIGQTGAGVQVGELQRVVDASLQADLRRRTGALAGQEIKEAYLQRVEELQGRPEDEQSLASTYGRVQDAFEKLSTSPESVSYQLEVVNEANALTEQLRSMSSQMLTLRNQTQVEIGASVETINGNLRRISDLNNEIIAVSQRGESTAHLEDQRDQSVLELSKYMDIQTVKSNDQRIIITTRSGLTLVDRSAQQLEFSQTTLDHNSYYSASPPGNIPGITLKSAPGRDITSALSGDGKLGALLELRDRTFPTLQGQLDEFAQKLAMRFEAAGMTLFTGSPGTYPAQPTKPGSPVPADIPGNYVGFAADIHVNPAATNPDFVRYGDAGAPAAGAPAVTNQRILNVLNYAMGDSADVTGLPHAAFRNSALGPNPLGNLTSDLPQVASLGSFVQTLVARQGQMRADVTAEKTRTEELKNAVETRSNDLSGVNLDTEMAQLTILQRSYSASAQVLRTAQQMMDTLFSAVR